MARQVSVVGLGIPRPALVQRKGEGGGPPEGSPTRTVAPPSSPTVWWPHIWNHLRAMMPSRLPMCRLEAVGSNPQYTLSLPSPAAFSRPSFAMSCIAHKFSARKADISGPTRLGPPPPLLPPSPPRREFGSKAVGSNPQYTLSLPSPAAFSRLSFAMSCVQEYGWW